MKTVYICYQAINRSILAITDTLEQAKKICNINDDAIVEIELNKNYGRKLIDTTKQALYNIDGNFKKLKVR